MSSPDLDRTRVPADRYGRPGNRRIGLVLGAVVAVAFLGWLGWATWFHANPEVTSSLAGYDVVDAHRVTAVLEVSLDDGAEDPNCRIQAIAADHSVVGALDFEPRDGRNEVTIATERLATSVERVGCTTNGQSRPR